MRAGIRGRDQSHPRSRFSVVRTDTSRGHKTDTSETTRASAWHDALEEAARAIDRCAQATNRLAAAQAIHRQGEVHRLRGDFAAAEQAYRDAATLAVSRSRDWRSCAWLKETPTSRPPRSAERSAKPSGGRSAWLLPAYVEIMLAVGDLEQARVACDELEELRSATRARCWGRWWRTHEARSSWRKATPGCAGRAAARSPGVAGARGAVRGRTHARARRAACRALGDDDTAALELEAARGVFAELGAAPDIARVDSLARREALPTLTG